MAPLILRLIIDLSWSVAEVSEDTDVVYLRNEAYNFFLDHVWNGKLAGKHQCAKFDTLPGIVSLYSLFTPTPTPTPPLNKDK
jgi:hypothetical protein